MKPCPAYAMTPCSAKRQRRAGSTFARTRDLTALPAHRLLPNPARPANPGESSGRRTAQRAPAAVCSIVDIRRARAVADQRE